MPFHISSAIRSIRFYSSFLRVFLILFLVISILLGIFLTYSFQQENRNLQTASEQSYLNILENTSTTLEMSLQNMQQILLETIWDSDFTSALVVPSEESYSRTKNILEKLQQLTEIYPYITSAYLYSSTSQMVYTSRPSYQPASQVPDLLFQQPEDLLTYEGVRLSDSNTSLFIKQIGDQIVLCQHLYPDYLTSLGALIFEFDLSAHTNLSSKFKASDDTLQCYVVDRTGAPIFVSSLPAPLQEYLSDKDLDSSTLSSVAYSGSGLTFLSYQSPATNWFYLFQLRTGQLQLYTPVPYIILFCTLGLGFAFLLSFLIASKANKPIRRLLSEMSSPSCTIDAKNDIDFLSKSYAYTTGQNEKLNEAIQGITPLVLERLLSRLLNGELIDEEQIDATLSGIHCPFPRHSIFSVMVLNLSSAASDGLTPLEYNLLLSKIQELLQQEIQPPGLSFLIPQGGTCAAAVLIFPKDLPEDSLQLSIQSLMCTLSRKINVSPYQLELGCGNLYNNLSDLKYSYFDAQKVLSRRRFYQNEEASSAGEALLSHNRYFETVQKMFLAIQAGNSSAAYTMMSDTLEEISHNSATADPYAQYRCFLRTFFELADTLHMGEREIFLQQEQALLDILEHTDADHLTSRLTEAMYKPLQSIERKNRSRISQHIARVQEYILEHYSDSTLSLESTAEHVGISSAYLSRLFKKETDSSFVDYVNMIRVQKAKYLLAQSNLKTKEIAFQTGFHSMQNFFRIFKRITGYTPGEYRANLKDLP